MCELNLLLVVFLLGVVFLFCFVFVFIDLLYVSVQKSQKLQKTVSRLKVTESRIKE